MRSIPGCLVLLGLSTLCLGSSWVGQKRVNRPNGAVPDGAPTIAMDASGSPWVVWDTQDTLRLRDTTLVFSVWQGDSWGSVCGVGPNGPDVLRRLNPSIAFDPGGHAWLSWDNKKEDNSDDVGSSFSVGSAWSDEIQVNLQDSTEFDFRPSIACGGGQVWCVWYGGLTDMSPYSVYASRWSEGTQVWEPETQVSPADGNHSWWCDVAVDTLGTPHVVWCTYPLYTVYYSYFDGEQWVTPTAVNDTSNVLASPWAFSRVVIDHDGVMHVSFTGAKVGATHRDIFYTFNDGAGWSSCQMVTRDSLYDEWTSDIAAENPDNVWIVWDRQNEGSDQFRVYAAHYDGQEFSAEQRLDDDSAYHDGCPSVCLDSQGEPWVVWNGISRESEGGDVFYNRIADVGCREEESGSYRRQPTLAVSTCNAAGPVRISYNVRSQDRVRLEVLDPLGRRVVTLVDARNCEGNHDLLWVGRVPTGTYFCRLTAGDLSLVSKIILMGR